MRRRVTLSAALIAAASSLAYPGDDLSRITLPETRAVDGSGNNERGPTWGATNAQFLRLVPADYADGLGEPAGADRPSARAVSNAVAAQEESIPNAAGVTDFLWQWGQFVDHDIVLTPVLDPAEPFDIAVPVGDPYFDPTGSGIATIGLDRSYSEEDDTGVRQQVNEITAFIDASNVYGSDEERARELRTLDGTGRLKTSRGRLLPFNEAGLPNAPSSDASFFLAGDFRANEQVGLTSLHTLFVREHNHWADQIRRRNRRDVRRERSRRSRGPAKRDSRRRRSRGDDAQAQQPVVQRMTGDEIYDLARALVGAEMQVITYGEFLPALLGGDAIPPYEGYDADLDPRISNLFATASYRVGHTMLSPTLLRLDRRGETIADGNLPLAQAFFNPTEISDHGIESILRGLATQQAQEIDTLLVNDVRNFLFGPPGAGGLDLASLNIQRGRDHGLPSHNQVRRDLGLEPAASFAELTSDPITQEQLASVYESVEDVDAWVGGLAEDHLPGAVVGETVFTVLRGQFIALRDGDRFWYQNHLPQELIQLAQEQTLAGIIRRNTRIGRELQPDVFRVR